jgi:NADPH-dependent curcumin reductase CurA
VGEVLCRTIYLSLDPYTARPHTARLIVKVG